LFNDFHLTRQMVLNMRQIEVEGYLVSHAWVIIPDHVHWLFQLSDKHCLSNMVGLFKGRTARIGNKYINQKGRFWQNAFHDHAIRKEEDIKQFARYIVVNPLRAGLVDKIEDYSHWDAMWL